MVQAAVLFYGPVALVSYLVLLWRHGWELFHPAPGWFFWSVVACAIGLLTCWLSKVFLGQFSWAKDMESEFLNVLGPITVAEVAVLAGTSSIAEEAFFRGVLQPWLGIFYATVIFAAVHVPMSKKLLAWPIFALTIGFVLGWLLLASGSLIPPIVMHATINGLNLYVIGQRARELGIPRRAFPPDPDERF